MPRIGTADDAFFGARLDVAGSGRVLLEEVRDGTFELGQLLVDLDHLVRADRLRRVDVRLVLCPLGAAVTPVEKVPVGV